MKVTGVFYLANGRVHKEVVRIPKKELKLSLEAINYMIDNFGRNKEAGGSINFGYFTASPKDIVAMQIKQYK